ncbi:MAG TPA: SPOR domain-containing protein [Gemmatimonadota bacterium]|nr:SPOR domain-containing protein [Gemmatimonadota bacterium]
MSKLPAVALLLAAAACMPARYREEPPAEDRADEAAARAATRAGNPSGEGATIVGHVSPDGALVADTLARSTPDTARVERETVVTGEIRPAVELETDRPAVAGDEPATLATGWRVQVYASRDETEAAGEATRVRDALAGEAPVYVERDAPWYKVRVGDFGDRAAADRLRERLAGLGWPAAWAVRTTIRTAP